MKCKFCGKENHETKEFTPEDYINLEKRLLNSIEKVGDCWIWKKATIGKDGYGIVSYDGRRCLAHRLAYELFKGKISEGKLVCHSCDNRNCINPNHLWVGTHKDNTIDCAKKGRMRGWQTRKKSAEEIKKITKNLKWYKGEKHSRSKLTEKQVIEIREKLERKVKYKIVAKEYGIGICSLSDIKFRRTWKHI